MDKILMKTVIERAIKNEEDAYLFYTNLLNLVDDPVAKKTLSFLAAEELKHKEFLVRFLEGSYTSKGTPMDAPVDYQVAQYVSMPDVKKDMSTSEVYLVAAHREWNAHQFYLGLAEIQPEGEIRSLLLEFAAQELRHKEKVEYLYSNTAFPQTAGG
ncbi:ferritin family protein [bacterium]|nr:ferritin family protein [candidate division CSSED10-310 bacterium]